MLYPEIALPAAQYLEKAHGQPYTKTVPIGVGATRDFIDEVAELAGVGPPALEEDSSRCPGIRARSIRLISPASASSFSATRPMRSRPSASRAKSSASTLWVSEPTAANSHAKCASAAKPASRGADHRRLSRSRGADRRAAPDLVLGTQMERHIAKRLGIPCAVISAPTHVQDFPARYSPQMGFEGANVLFDSWVHPLMMGLEEHLMACFATTRNSTKAPGPRILEPQRRADTRFRSRARRRGERGPMHLGRRRDLDRRSGKGAEENSLLRARQGARQHREIRARARTGHHNRRDAVRCESPLRSLTRSALRHRHAGQSSGERGRSRAPDA